MTLFDLASGIGALCALVLVIVAIHEESKP